MIFKLSLDEVLKVCNSCERFDKDHRECRTEDDSGTISLKTLRKCKKWDDHFRSPCLYLG